jgi:hypothetical protein
MNSLIGKVIRLIQVLVKSLESDRISALLDGVLTARTGEIRKRHPRT